MNKQAEAVKMYNELKGQGIEGLEARKEIAWKLGLVRTDKKDTATGKDYPCVWQVGQYLLRAGIVEAVKAYSPRKSAQEKAEAVKAKAELKVKKAEAKVQKLQAELVKASAVLVESAELVTA